MTTILDLLTNGGMKVTECKVDCNSFPDRESDHIILRNTKVLWECKGCGNIHETSADKRLVFCKICLGKMNKVEKEKKTIREALNAIPEGF